MASIAPVIRHQFTDDEGNLLVGGKLYTYENGTVTPKATYADKDLSAANPNPIILDARGEAEIWLDGEYSIRLEDADGNLIYTQDDLTSFGEDSFCQYFSYDENSGELTIDLSQCNIP